MESKVAIILTNYNMPEQVNRMGQMLDGYCDPDRYQFVVVDNGSYTGVPSPWTTLRLEQNVQTCQGWLAGLKYVDLMVEAGRWPQPKYYATTITSTSLVERKDILTPMLDFMDRNQRAVGIHPSLTSTSTTAWDHLKNRGTDSVRRTWFIDNIFAMWRADWFDMMGRFDPKLTYAWGVDFDMCWKARAYGRGLYVDDRTQVEKVTDIGYKMDRMGMTAQDRVANASAEMKQILSKKYGPDWNTKVREEFVRDEWR